MGQAYEEKTEHLIEMFMKYSDKKSLDVNENKTISYMIKAYTSSVFFSFDNVNSTSLILS